MDLDTGELRALVAIADAGNFGRAAHRLGITQQGVSRRVARLEQRLDRLLVDRSDRRLVRLTADGADVVRAARTILATLDGPALTPRSKTVVVDQLADSLLATAWARRAARAGELPVETVERPLAESAESLVLNGRADVAFGRIGAVTDSLGGRHPDPRLRSRLVMLEPVALLVPAAHPWSRRESVAWSDLAECVLWFPTRSAPREWRSWLDEFARASGATILTEGAGFGFDAWGRDVTDGRVPPSLIGEGMRSPVPDARVVPVVDPVPVFAWSVFWREGSTAIEPFLEAANLTVSPAVGTGTWMPDTDRAPLVRTGTS